MKLGITLKRLDEKVMSWFDLVLFPLRQVTGEVRAKTAHPKARPVVSCFGHTVAATKHPDWVAISEDGLPALPGKKNLRDGFAWGWVCPNVEEHRENLLAFAKQLARFGHHRMDFGDCEGNGQTPFFDRSP